MIEEGKQYNNWLVKEILDDENCLCECQCERHTQRIVNIQSIERGLSKSCGCTRYIKRKKDLVGQHFGDWEVLKMLPDRKALCRCVVCGTEKIQYHSNLTRTGYNFKCNHIGEVGKRYGNWLVLEELGGGKIRCQCQCEAKTIRDLYKKAVLSGETKSCGCQRGAYANILHKHFGEWEVLDYADKQKQTYLCKCSCGNIKIKHKVELTHGRSRSCGCKQGENIKQTIQAVYDGVYPQNLDYSSQAENEIASYIQDDLSLEIIQSCRSIISPNEIDIYIPSLKIGIEYNGNFWHNSKNKPRNYHRDKTFQCESHGVRLIHIFEYEWETNKDLIKQYLRDTLCDKEVIYARQTELINVNGEIAKNFINKYHLQGYAASEINIGLKYNDEVVGMMTFGHPRFNTDAEYELIRLCFKSGYSVVGGAEKMFKAFVENYKPSSIISYCNIAKFTGKVYNNLGFKINRVTEPNYVWCKGRDIKTRYQTQKNRLVKQELGTSDMTEDQIMQSLGYVKIYDCGNLQCIWKNDNNNERK